MRLSGNVPSNWKHVLAGAGPGGGGAQVVMSAMHDPTSENVPKKDASAPEEWFEKGFGDEVKILSFEVFTPPTETLFFT